MIRKWRRTYLNFKIVVTPTLGWEDDPDGGGSNLAHSMLSAIAGGVDVVPDIHHSSSSSSSSSRHAPTLAYKRTLLAWYDSDPSVGKVTTDVVGGGVVGKPPLGTICIDHNTKVQRTTAKVRASTHTPSLFVACVPAN